MNRWQQNLIITGVVVVSAGLGVGAGHVGTALSSDRSNPAHAPAPRSSGPVEGGRENVGSEYTYGSVVAYEACGQTAKFCIGGHVQCEVDCWWSIDDEGRKVTGLSYVPVDWDDESGTWTEPWVIEDCNDTYQAVCWETEHSDNGPGVDENGEVGLRVDCDAKEVWCDDEGA